jgi:outer membrane immunogenic protein
MHRFSFAALAAVAVFGFASVASAADMPTKAPIVTAPAVMPYNWTGFYVGAVGTYGWGDSQHCEIGEAVLCLADGPFTNMKGWEGGVTAGYNWQWNQWVFGAEGDWSWGKLNGSSRDVPDFGCGGGGQTCDTWINSIGTARARVGYAFDRFLPYLTVGAAFSDLHAAIGPAGGRSTDSTTKTDFVWGGGLEYAFWQNFSAKLEYLNITKLGDFTYDAGAACGAATRCYVHVGSINLVRFGLNYKFWTP